MNSGRRASRKTPPKKTPPAADRTVAETVDRRPNELRPAERRAAGTLLADYPSAGLERWPILPSEPGLARHRVMRFAQGRGYDGFTAVPSALREELTQRSKGPLGRVRWDIEHGSNSELLLRRARQVSDLALEHRICVAAVAGAGRVTRIAVQRFQRCGRAFSVGCPIEQLRNVGAEVLLSAQHARHLQQPMETHALPFRGLLVDLAAFQAPAGYCPRLHRICPPGQVVLHLRHRKLPAPCARGRRHGSRSVGWRLRSPRTRPRARPRVLHPTTGRHHGSRTPQTPPPATPTQGTPRQPEQLHRPVRPPPHARGLRIAETWAGVSVGAAGFYSSC